jgi:AcrR family transcriptional regulator
MPDNGERKRPGNKVRAVRGEKKRFYLHQARRLFAEFGYSATSFEQIADASGVTRSVLVRSFRDKAAFLRGIGDDWLEALFPPPDPDDAIRLDVIAQLLAMTERFLAILQKDQQTARILLSGLAERVEEEESTILQAILQAAIDRFVPLFQEGQQSGVIRRGIDARLMASDWLRFLLGAALMPPTEAKEGETQPSFVETLLHGVLKTDV